MQPTIVIKIGGGRGIDLAPVACEFASFIKTGVRAVLVHGGSHDTDELARQLGHPPRSIVSPSGHQSRRTDARTLEIFTMVYCGKINKALVAQLRSQGVDAVGLSGIDAGIWTASRKEAIRAIEEGRVTIIRDDLTGKVESVNAGFLNMLLDSGRVPVLTPPAVTSEGIAVNVDADRAAAATAAALGADELLLLSNVPGVLRHADDPTSLIGKADDIAAIRSAAKGRMKNKVLAAEEAVAGGVGRVVIGSAVGRGAIEGARRGVGTVFEGAIA